MNEKKPVVCLGILVADVVGRPVTAIPPPGSLALVEEIGLYTGGCAFNTASALACLGLPVEVIGLVGVDPFGDYLLNELSERYLGNRGVKRIRGVGTSATMVLVDPEGERRFIHYIGANAYLRKEDIDLEIIANASILHVAGALVMPGIDGAPTSELLQYAHQSGVTTFMDTAWDDTGRWMNVLESCLPHLDYFIPSLSEAQALTGLVEPMDIARKFLDYGIGTVGIKMGRHGCLVLTRQDQVIRVPAFQVVAVDATGAGDAFAAGFIAGIWLNWPIEKTALLANAVGALCVTGVGASGSLLNFNETLNFMEITPLGEL